MNKKKYVEPAVGTIRGPFVCGKGNFISGHTAGLQYLVKLVCGAWGGVIGWRKDYKQLAIDAKEMSKKELAKLVQV